MHQHVVQPRIRSDIPFAYTTFVVVSPDVPRTFKATIPGHRLFFRTRDATEEYRPCLGTDKATWAAARTTSDSRRWDKYRVRLAVSEPAFISKHLGSHIWLYRKRSLFPMKRDTGQRPGKGIIQTDTTFVADQITCDHDGIYFCNSCWHSSGSQAREDEYSSSGKLLISRLSGVEVLTTSLALAVAIMEDCSSSERPPSLDNLPTEITCMISDHLPELADRWALQFSCKTLCDQLSAKRDHQVTGPVSEHAMREWMERLARDMPGHNVCDSCHIIHSPLNAWRSPNSLFIERIPKPCQVDYVVHDQRGSWVKPRVPVLIVKAALSRHRQGLPVDWLLSQGLQSQGFSEPPVIRTASDWSVVEQRGVTFYDGYMNDLGEFVLETTTMVPDASDEALASVDEERIPRYICEHWNFMAPETRQLRQGVLHRCAYCLVEFQMERTELDMVGTVELWKTWKQVSWKGAVLLMPGSVPPSLVQQTPLGGISTVTRADAGWIELRQRRSAAREAVLRPVFDYLRG
ncbi:hypothetical protein Micbo1qcDRAFT_173285 [Microdochium bolleyi]|uniref:Uncharacterized protein n=1 Tax=Microdochium bolleyi TaxID=196109 RepID=A0A136JBK3_9PEZI|nr:hypothetical protein Micbo1qcDRAFT_173285 [Microdochium bolleyi]